MYISKRGEREFLISYRLYIRTSARICNFHLNNDCWDQLETNHFDFTSTQMDDLLAISLNKINFSNVYSIPPQYYWLGLTATEFNKLLLNITQLHEQVPDASVARSIYLTKLRTGDSNERLTGLFNMPRSTLVRYIKAKNIMTDQLVPLYLGFSHMTIEKLEFWQN